MSDLTHSPSFLLAQVGAHATQRLARRLTRLDVSPAMVGILRELTADEGLSQQALARRLGCHPSRLVALLDSLEEKRLVERRPSDQDRRVYALYLTANGRRRTQQLTRVLREHERALLAALSEQDRKQLTRLLQRIAAQQALAPGVHPGYRGDR